ncbi:MAG: nitrilase-related carbon-nitrogen hydrolase [Sporichthyaceae bacterium]
MRVALIQLEVSLREPIDARRGRAAELVRTCAGADLVVLPELWAHGPWDYAAWSESAESVDGPTAQTLAAAAADIAAVVHAGTIVERAGDELFNTALVFGRDGAPLTTYRKIHRFGFSEGEATLMTPGQECVHLPSACTSLPLSMGIATCYDLRFPELFRVLTEAGAQVFAIASSWPLRRLEHWRLLCRARAVENLAYVVATDACGTHSGVTQAGHSVVVDPWGEVLAEAGTQECVLEVVIDTAKVEAVRADFPVLRDRRLRAGPDARSARGRFTEGAR